MSYQARQVYVITTPAKVDVFFETKREAQASCPTGYKVQQRYLTSNWCGEKLLVPIDDEYKYTKVLAPDFHESLLPEFLYKQI